MFTDSFHLKEDFEAFSSQILYQKKIFLYIFTYFEVKLFALLENLSSCYFSVMYHVLCYTLRITHCVKHSLSGGKKKISHAPLLIYLRGQA